MSSVSVSYLFKVIFLCIVHLRGYNVILGSFFVSLLFICIMLPFCVPLRMFFVAVVCNFKTTSCLFIVLMHFFNHRFTVILLFTHFASLCNYFTLFYGHFVSVCCCFVSFHVPLEFYCVFLINFWTILSSTIYYFPTQFMRNPWPPIGPGQLRVNQSMCIVFVCLDLSLDSKCQLQQPSTINFFVVFRTLHQGCQMSSPGRRPYVWHPCPTPCSLFHHTKYLNLPAQPLWTHLQPSEVTCLNITVKEDLLDPLRGHH